MKKTEMLKKNYEFKYVFSRGKYFYGKYLDAFIIKRYECINKLGICVSSKIAKANKRNRIKRLIREGYKEIEENLDTGVYVIFLWKKNVKVEYANFENIKSDIKHILKKAELLEESV